MSTMNLHFVDEALRLVHKAEEQGIRLRILGSLAFRIHSPNNADLLTEMGRELTDVDFAAERKQSRAIREFLTGEGYVPDNGLIVGTEGARHAYTHRVSKLNVDVFTDELYFCHPIPLKGRLHLDYPTITTTDLLLEKMQIVEINLKDIKDALVLMLEHPLGDPSEDKENIDPGYITRIMSTDWGFYYTFTMNLRKLLEFMPGFSVIKDGHREMIRERVDSLLQRVEEAPKSMRWKIRAKVGTRRKWYQEVSEKGKVF